MNITPDQIVYFQHGPVALNATIVWTWVVMGLMVLGSWRITRRLTSGPGLSRWQSLLEVLVLWINEQIQGITQQQPRQYLPFAGTLFLFIAASNLLSVVPGYLPPTGSLSTTTALASCVFVAVPMFGIQKRGVLGFFGSYVKPTVFMLPFNVLGELSRTLALAVRLFGNVMSGTMIGAILLAIVPLLFPVVLQLLGLLTGLVQAYVFAILALLYIASATRVREKQDKTLS